MRSDVGKGLEPVYQDSLKAHLGPAGRRIGNCHILGKDELQGAITTGTENSTSDQTNSYLNATPARKSCFGLSITGITAILFLGIVKKFL